MKDKELPIGIPGGDFVYHQCTNEQNLIGEFFKTREFIKELLKARGKELFPIIMPNEEIAVRFMNWGYTQLVYLLSSGNKEYALLIGQPSAVMGVVEQEYNNLQTLAKEHPNDIACPITYFKNENREAYVAPYYSQARCIASTEEGWGVYVPEPEYHFSLFAPEIQQVVNSAMIANLVKMYNDQLGQGIAKCHLGGGDFILEKHETVPTNVHEALARMKLIAARDMIKVPFNEYLNLLRTEFTKRTYRKTPDPNIKINTRGRAPMTEQEVENGIQIGLQLRNEMKKSSR